MLPLHLRRVVRHLVDLQVAWWCIAFVLLAALQPFIAVHFREDGWEDEPGLRIRAASATVQFEPDERPEHASSRETTLFVPSSAGTDLPDILRHGLERLMAMVLAMLPLVVALRNFPRLATCAPLGRGRAAIRAPPLSSPWRRSPPRTAPPQAT